MSVAVLVADSSSARFRRTLLRCVFLIDVRDLSALFCQKMTKSQLNAEQARAVHMIVHEHASIFLTGVAGTGKSFTVATAVALLRTLKDATYEIALTAMTGVAACNIGGKTLHGFVGMGLMKEDSDVLCKRVASSKCLRKQWNRISLLVIDEISMMDPCLFSKVDRIARTARGCHTRPFGGLQVVLVGDFLQLSPVGVAEFCFQAESWAELVQHTVSIFAIIIVKRTITRSLAC